MVLCCCSGESHQDGTRTGPSTPPSSGGVSLGQPVAARAGQWCAIRLRSRWRLLGLGLGVPVKKVWGCGHWRRFKKIFSARGDGFGRATT